MAALCAEAVLDPREDFPAWLGAHGVSARVLEAVEAELGIGDYEALLACAAQAPVRAELLAAAKERLPFAFYAALRRVAEQVGRGAGGCGGGHHDGPSDGYATADGPFYQSLFSSLLGAIVVMLNNLSCELLRSAERFTSLERLVNAGGGGVGVAGGIGGDADDMGEEADLTPCSTDETEESMDEHKYGGEDDGEDALGVAPPPAEPGRMAEELYPDEAEGYTEGYSEGYGEAYGHSPKAHAEHGAPPRHFPRVKHEPQEGFSEDEDGACPVPEPSLRWQRRAGVRGLAGGHGGPRAIVKKRTRSPEGDGAAAPPPPPPLPLHGQQHQQHQQQHFNAYGAGSSHGEAPLNGQRDGFAKAEGHVAEHEQGDCAGEASGHCPHGVNHSDHHHHHQQHHHQQQQQQQPHLFPSVRFPHKLLNHHYACGDGADPSAALQHRSLPRADAADAGAGGASDLDGPAASSPSAAPADGGDLDGSGGGGGGGGGLLWPALDDYGKVYQCDDCGKGFLNRSYLYVHRRKHTGERPYACDVCGRRFSVTYNLARHKKTHTGEKPFVCRECGLAFRLKHHLLRHEKKHSLALDGEPMGPDGAALDGAALDGAALDGSASAGEAGEGTAEATEAMMYDVTHLHPTG
ncbi:uncharacterized protein LOC116955088 [Petromyzon marinus]|uniref:Zinc finger protein 316-like n=1 Tax=Petromyzon marinus TaxID=7757 RepID=A0AAJ7XEN7_PETMA|nr:zinc finger protein 316-like [Petromyzon marinus]XP_032831947.1 zinc finger protein 316-like [Petromyzon marinus]XP_032831949.1 zinc finger protein 316-like [Petromyzon marinus]XP_032831950.1 zinc finger protein 316-like [Petromyzon marinus]